MNIRYGLVILSIIFLEWLDFSLYLYLAKSFFSTLFFPDNGYQEILSFGLFAGAYMARPIGGYIFGKMADQKGRKPPMFFSSALMGIATFGVCLLPTYASIGLSATLLLLFCRVCQGIAIGGEINTSAMFLIEHYQHRPLFAGSLIAGFGASGMFLGGLIASILMHHLEYWRVVFAMLGLISLMVCYYRRQIQESPQFSLNNAQQVSWRNFIPNLSRIGLLGAYASILVYVCNIFWVSFATDYQVFSIAKAAKIGAIAQLGSGLIAISLGYGLSAFTPRTLLKWSASLLIFVSPLLYYATYMKIYMGIYVGLVGYALANGLMGASMFYYLYQQLPVNCRCQGISTTWGVTACAGAIALPISAKALMSGFIWFPGSIPVVMAIITWLLI